MCVAFTFYLLGVVDWVEIFNHSHIHVEKLYPTIRFESLGTSLLSGLLLAHLLTDQEILPCPCWIYKYPIARIQHQCR